MGLRSFSRALHRDLGFFCIGLTVVYALSGIAVNHIDHWNPNYRIARAHVVIPPSDFRGVVGEAMALDLLRQIGEQPTYDHLFQPDPERLMIFVDGRRILFHFPSGTVEHERIERRAFWYPLNSLHLNRGKGAWTWIADFYAVGLLLLALTGLLLLPRDRLRRRGLLLTVLGICLPLLWLLLSE